MHRIAGRGFGRPGTQLRKIVAKAQKLAKDVKNEGQNVCLPAILTALKFLFAFSSQGSHRRSHVEGRGVVHLSTLPNIGPASTQVPKYPTPLLEHLMELRSETWRGTVTPIVDRENLVARA